MTMSEENNPKGAEEEKTQQPEQEGSAGGSAVSSPPLPEEPEEKKAKGHNSVVWLTRIVFLLAALIFIWYVYSDRRTPYTDLGTVTEIVIPVTPRVSGYLIERHVKLHSAVKAGDLMFRIDTTQYALAVRKARANVANVAQQMGAQGAAVQAAASAVGVARAQLDRAQRNYNRAMRIVKKNPGALSQADIDRVETSLNQAVENLANAEANLTKARKQLGPTGTDNPQLRMAINDLNNAQMQLEWTSIYAPADGHLESFNMDVGYFCQAGKPIATLVSKEDLWIQANFKENNLSHMKPGNPVEFILDVAPGRVFSSRVSSIGYGVSSDNKNIPGKLPVVNRSSSWLRDPQRFPVIIGISDTTAQRLCRAGAQADVVVYTGDHPFLNSIARLRIRINSLLSYVR